MNIPFVPTIRVPAVKIRGPSVPSMLPYETAFLPLMKQLLLSKEGQSKVREQIAQQPARRRAGLPPEEREYAASRHAVDSRSGMHPEDRPYMTSTSSRSHAPTTATYFEVDEEGEDIYTRPPIRTSARRYDLTPYRHGRGERQTEELPRPGKHPIFYIGISMVILVVFLTAYTLIPPALQNWSDDRTYGYPRTFQTDANVGHGGMEHFLALNNHGTIEVLEIPTDPTKNQPHLYIITHLAGQGADLISATVSFPDVNGGKPHMVVTVFNGTNPTEYFLFNNGTSFVPKL
jgi:hypothetical protein